MTYDNAKDNCAEKLSNGGKLFEPATWDENKLVTTAFNDVHWSGGCWIGVNDIAVEANFKYESSGATIPFNPTWYPGYQNKGTTTNCVWVYKAGRWGVNSCIENHPSICKL